MASSRGRTAPTPGAPRSQCLSFCLWLTLPSSLREMRALTLSCSKNAPVPPGVGDLGHHGTPGPWTLGPERTPAQRLRDKLRRWQTLVPTTRFRYLPFRGLRCHIYKMGMRAPTGGDSVRFPAYKEHTALPGIQQALNKCRQGA